MALYHRGMYTQSPPMLVAQLLLLLSLAYLLKCLLRVCSEPDTLLFSPWRWEYSSEKIKKQQTKSLPSWCLYSPGERQTINKSNGDNCYGRIPSREERRVEGCGSYNCKQGGQGGLPKKEQQVKRPWGRCPLSMLEEQEDLVGWRNSNLKKYNNVVLLFL